MNDQDIEITIYLILLVYNLYYYFKWKKRNFYLLTAINLSAAILVGSLLIKIVID